MNQRIAALTLALLASACASKPAPAELEPGPAIQAGQKAASIRQRIAAYEANPAEPAATAGRN